MTPTGGSHGKPHWTTKVLSDARRRGGCVAARGVRAAGGEAADHWFPESERAFGRKRMGRRFGAATARRRDLAHKAATSAWVGAQP